MVETIMQSSWPWAWDEHAFRAISDKWDLHAAVCTHCECGWYGYWGDTRVIYDFVYLVSGSLFHAVPHKLCCPKCRCALKD